MKRGIPLDSEGESQKAVDELEKPPEKKTKTLERAHADEEDAEASLDSPPAQTKMISSWGADAIREREKIRRAGWFS